MGELMTRARRMFFPKRSLLEASDSRSAYDPMLPSSDLNMARRGSPIARQLCDLRRDVGGKDDRADRGHDRRRRSLAIPDRRRQNLALRKRASDRKLRAEWVVSDQLSGELEVTRRDLDALEITILALPVGDVESLEYARSPSEVEPHRSDK